MSDAKILSGGAPVASEILVSADQETIIGDGSAERPLHTNSLDTEADEQVLAGMPCYIEGDDFVEKAIADAVGSAEAIGLAVAPNATITDFSTPITLRTSGPLELTTAQWDALTGGSGGLQGGLTYYLSSTTAGHLTSTKPSATGTFVTLIGVALNPTTMMIKLGAALGPHA